MPISLHVSRARKWSAHKKGGKLEYIGVEPPYTDVSHVNPYFCATAGGGAVKLML
jgi:hypothetical protein